MYILVKKYKYFHSPGNHDRDLGVHFYHLTTNRGITNFPKQHYDNGVLKQKVANDQFKSVVRIIKNARSYAVDKGLLAKGKAPSYFLQGLLFNIPNSVFVADTSKTIHGVLDYLYSAYISGFVCQNGKHLLFGPSEEQWNTVDARETINALVYLWNNWHTV